MTPNLVLKAVTETPWAITEAGLQRVLYVVTRGELYNDEGRKALAARLGQKLDNTRAVTVRDRVAIVPVEGVLCRKAPWFADVSGATSYEILRRDIQQAVDNPSIDAILLQVHSPGGEADGCNELARFILEARDKKQIWAYASLAASGGLWIAAAASRIVAAETAFIGSIGVRQTLVDDSGFDEKMGVREIELVSMQSPRKRGSPIDEELLARYQVHINDLAQIFVDFVAECRGTDGDDVIQNFGNGDVMIAGKALEAGMVDGIGNFESTLAELVASLGEDQVGTAIARATAKERTRNMSVKKTETTAAPVAATAPPPARTASMGDQTCSGCGRNMGPESAAYCQGCFDGDEDEEEAKALGLEPTAARAARLERAASLAALERDLVTATGAKTAKEAFEKVGALSAELAQAKADGQRRELRAALEKGLDGQRLSLGAIQKTLPVVLRGAPKSAWSKAMGALKSVTRETVLEAACSVPLAADDVQAIAEYVSGSAPIAAEPFVEPARDPEKESAELDETNRKIDAAIKKTKATLDRGKSAATTTK